MDINLIEKAKASKTFCIYPWIQQYVSPDGEIKPCCVYAPLRTGVANLKQSTLKEAWNNENTKKIRLDMLHGIEIKDCENCNIDGIVNSVRYNANKDWVHKNIDIVNSTKEDGSLPNHTLKYLDARFNNLCNFKCRTCTPTLSTSWHEDYTKFKSSSELTIQKPLIVPGKTENQLYDEILPHLNTINVIYFAGGEPLMQEEHYKVLQELIKLGHTGTREKSLEIRYSTNFSNLKLGKHNALEYWKYFSKVTVSASIDGSYKKAEYWRKGTDWNVIVNNRLKLKSECPNVNFNIGFTLSWVNAFDLIDLHKEWTDLKFIDINDIYINLLQGPDIYSLKNIPNWKKKKIEKAYLEHLEWLKINKAFPKTLERFKDVIKFLNTNDLDNFFDKQEFIWTTTTLDKIRNENFWDVYPEHIDMKEYYGFNTV